ncbi:MAG TPA: hypothetical protein VN794_21370, partial [Methylomirabilota bacterium]|nr:hypothetical protein [Methylomirabilota bacterium]
HDDKFGALGTFPGPLAVGGTITISNLRTNWAETTTNITSVSAQCGGVHANGAAVGASTNVVAAVIQAGIACQKLVSVNGSTPAQSLTNNCSGATNTIVWYVTVTNTGLATLCNLVVSELGTGPDLLPCGAVNIGLTNCLAPGEGTGLIPLCSTTVGCVETRIENSIRVRGVAAAISNACSINLTGSNIVAQSQCSASVTLHRALSITKACASPIATNVGSSLTVTGIVCNLGDQDLTNVTIIDSQPGLPTSLTNVIELLPAGQCSPYSFTYTATSCDANHDVVSAFGRDLAGSLVGPVSASADCFLCCPGISIQALVGCLQPGATCPPSSASYGPTATGVRGNTGDPLQDNPAFCYIIVVRNTGHDPLTNIVIHDDQLGALGTFPGPLAVGGTITISNLRTNWAETTTNTATVTAQCGGVHANGAAVGASTNAVANVLQAGIDVHKLVSVNGSTPVHVSTPVCGTIATNITWYVEITNSGEATLCNITVRELGIGPDLLPCGAVNIALTNCLAPGQSTGLIPLCTLGFNTCVETNLENSVRVQAVVAAISNACAINLTGSNIVAEGSCTANLSLCCLPAEPEPGCRVTGGGRQDSPEACPDDVRFVTHGGQVGGPFGSANCIVTLDQLRGNRCIRGRWTHVRHSTAGLAGNFHARYFDTLACACLGDGLVNTNTCEYELGVVVDGICNPVEADGNGHSAGRAAPANKIVFTGVGDWADPNGIRKPRTALFRVDIEDRGEPGGAKPLDGERPADRYRIRIWVLTDDELLRLSNPADGLINLPPDCDSCTTVSRNAIRACLGIRVQDGLCGPNACATNPNGQTCFELPASVPVRLPDIDDGGELKNGNEQIHPQPHPCP